MKVLTGNGSIQQPRPHGLPGFGLSLGKDEGEFLDDGGIGLKEVLHLSADHDDCLCMDGKFPLAVAGREYPDPCGRGAVGCRIPRWRRAPLLAISGMSGTRLSPRVPTRGRFLFCWPL